MPRPDSHPFDSVLKRGLDAHRDSAGQDCPDDAIMAAYCDRSLPAAQSAQVEEHFSNCARCQGTLAAIGRARTQQHPVRRAPVMRRLELYGAIAAGVAGIFIAVGVMRHRSEPGALYSSRRSSAAAPSGLEDSARRSEAGAQIAKNEAPSQPSQEAAQQQPPAAAAPAPAAGSMPSAPPPVEMAERAKIPQAAPRAALGGLSMAPVEREASSARLAEKVSALPMISVAGVERWRIGPLGAIEHRDADGSWRRQPSGVSATLRAGSSPYPTVCWVVGDAGTILRTTDAQHWRRIDSPTSADLVAVSAANASAATVTASDGRRFHTTDAGRTWRSVSIR